MRAAGSSGGRIVPLIAPVGACLGSLWLYLGTLAPTITDANNSGDSGELAAAVVSGGLAHPTGYPLYLLLGRLVTLGNWAEPARMLNVFSAVCAALAVAAASATVSLLTRLRDRPAAWMWTALSAAIAAAALAVAPVVWTQAVITETRGLAACLIAATLVAVVLVRRERAHPALLAGLTSLSLGDHLMALTVVPGAALIALIALRGRDGRAIAATIAAACTGPALYLYLPIRAAGNPPMDWGDPRTPERLWAVVSGAQYRYQMGNAGYTLLENLQNAWDGLYTQLPWPLLGLSLIGLLWLLRADLLLGAAFGLTFALSFGATMFYHAAAAPYYILPAVIAVVSLIGCGVVAIAETVIRERTARSAWVVATGVAILGAWALIQQAGAARSLVRLAGSRQLADTGRQLLQATGRNGVLLSQGDDATFPIWYARYALGERRDVQVVDVFSLRWSWYARNVARLLHLPPDVAMRMVAAGPDMPLDNMAMERRLDLLARAIVPHRPLFTVTIQSSLYSYCDQGQVGPIYQCLPQ